MRKIERVFNDLIEEEKYDQALKIAELWGDKDMISEIKGIISILKNAERVIDELRKVKHEIEHYCKQAGIEI